MQMHFSLLVCLFIVFKKLALKVGAWETIGCNNKKVACYFHVSKRSENSLGDNQRLYPLTFIFSNCLVRLTMFKKGYRLFMWAVYAIFCPSVYRDKVVGFK